MQEIGIESKLLGQILDGTKTIEARLGKPKYLKIRAGDQLSLREDIWEGGEVRESIPNQAVIRVKQVLYFEYFEEMLSALGYHAAVPSASSASAALATYRRFYSSADEYEHGVVALLFELVS